MMNSEETKVESKYNEYMKNVYKGSTYKNRYADVLGAIAVIELIVSIVGATYIWKTMATIDRGLYYSSPEYNPFGVGLSFTILIQGIILFIVMQTLKTTAKDVVEIKNKILSKE
ncbi:hypothetical protein Curi_c13960 [Gottschalkia acidurici 9a]|uniref:Uncharacterized protein n=1 Tax=Gottschalkia acidurici (strain ATCC 7906 / DSM 604 / BCRC 14475 / CIP 104303 / KCTC 5404 / NCIMB 10678 / 9a) TaxID=1128398 RepID=K0B1A0_GOTA9|nr:hypothetical protein [Gottschalkia acidurici]AFS78406.1 hypothetical protein Curi_c13960 [Gottschalkia acidurici 9a]